MRIDLPVAGRDVVSAEQMAGRRSGDGRRPAGVRGLDYWNRTMLTDMTRFTETIGCLQHVQQLLQLLLDDAAELLAEQPDEENEQWLAVVVDKMCANLREQFQIEEQDGYMADVLERYPEWHPQTLHLQEEHQLLEKQLREITTRMRRERLSGRLSHECRRQLQDWITWYRQHQRRETALVQEAFVLEVGEGE